ncbi:MAG: hypothetical protein R8K53_00925 [Mariprofundaceae bacterium]
MKIRPGQPLRPQKNTSQVQGGITDSRFQSLLDGELQTTSDKQHDFSSHEQTPSDQQQQLFSDATRLLDEAIEQIESDHAPRKQTIESLQQVRKKLANMGATGNDLTAANTILAVETERLKSW